MSVNSLRLPQPMSWPNISRQMAPMRHAPAYSSVVVLDEYSLGLPLREGKYYLCKNEYPSMHIFSDLESDVKVSISKLRQSIR